MIVQTDCASSMLGLQGHTPLIVGWAKALAPPFHTARLTCAVPTM
jgi:hypothetical protein